MKSLIAAIAMTAIAAPAFAEAKLGETLPAFSATTIKGDIISPADFEGQNVVLEWTNHGCPFVKKHYNSGNMQDTQDFAAETGAVWITVISSAPGKQGHVSAEEAAQIAEEKGASPTHIVLDPTGEIGKLYGARTTPHMFIGDDEGTLAYAGAIDSIRSGNPADIPKAENYVVSALTSLRDGEKVETRWSQAYGCDVKYGS